MIKVRATKGYSTKTLENSVDLSKIRATKIKKNNEGGFLGGLGYVGGSIAAGLGGIVEGVIDASIAPLADLFGDHEYAEYLFKNNVVGDWHNSITEEYNPTGFMKFLGDVGHGLGQSSVLLIPYAGAPMFFQGIISQSISGAVEQTGDVGVKEAAYGFTSGAIEAGLEYVLGAAGKGAKSIGSAIAKNTGKGTVKRVTSSAVRKGLVGKVISSATGEFFEEAASEIIDVGLQKAYQINPDAKINWNDVLYAGVVGAVSGAVMGGSIEGIQTLQNRSAGQKIIRDGNAQTLVNTATAVADKLAKQGTNFKKAPEWVKTLRGEVDAYNKLVEKGQQTSASAETILGEMKASLFFAEIQSAHYGLTENIKNSSEENRATLAEYVNKSIDKKNRPRDYTAEDIANDTDGIATQLGIMQFASPTFINYADAISSIEADQAQENAIGDVVSEMQTQSAETQAEQSGAVQNKAVPAAEAVTVNQESGVGGVANQANAGIFNANAGVVAEGEAAKSDLANPLEGAKYSVATAKKAKAKIKENAARAERTRQARLNEEGQAVEGASKEQSAESEILEQKSAEKADKTVESKTKEKSAETKNEADKPVIRKPKEALTDKQRVERAVKRAEKLIEWENKTQPTTKELNTAREYIKDFDSLPPSMRTSVFKMLRSADGKVDKNTLKGVANLMTMRRRDGRLVMPDLELRFAEGIVDGGLYTHIGEGENRRVLILINSDADFKETVKGTIAHEVVHYIENRKGYRELADYVLKTAKKEKIAEIEGEYNEHYKGIYTAEAKEAGLTGEAITKKVAERMATEDYKDLIKSEVVAKLIGLRLNNEKFLKKYATKDDAMIKKIFRYLRATVSNLKDKDKATADEMTELVNMFDKVIKGNVTSEEKTGETKFIKYSAMNKESLASNVDKILQMSAEDAIANKEAGNFVSVMKNTPTIIIENVEGAENLEIVMRFDSFYLATRHEGALEGHYHNYGEIMKRLPEIIADPQAIIRMDSGRINIYSQIQTKKGNNSIVSIELNTVKDINSKYDKYNLLVSVMPAKDNYARNNLVNHGVKVEYEKEDLPQVNHQLHKWLAIVNERSSNSSIPQKSDLSTGSEKKTVTRTNSEKMQDTDKRDLAPGKTEKKTEEPVSDEYFAAAEARAYEGEIREYILQNARYYYKSEFNKAFWDARNVGGEVLGDILSGKKTTVNGADLDKIKSAVYTAMYKASYEGKVGAVDAVKAVAEKAAKRYIENQTIYDDESKRWVLLTKYIDDAELIAEYEKALTEKLYDSFANSGKNLRNFQNFSLQKEAAEKFRQMYFDFKELEKYKKQASNNAMDLKQIANMQKRAAADEGIRMLAKAMGDTVNKHGMIRASKIDAVLAQVSDFYNLETNVKIFGESENGEQPKTLTDYAQVYDKGARNKIDKLLKLRKERQGKALTSEEMKLWAQILGAMRATINQYNGLYKDGKWFDRTKVAGDLAKDVVSYFGYNTEKKFKNVFLEGLYKTGKWLKENYFYSVISPETLIEGLEGYAHRGVLKTFFHSVRDASALADTVRAKLLIKFETFLDSNENVWEEKNRKIKFREKLNKKSIDLFGNEITLGEAIYLYGLCKREHAQAGLAKEGIKIYDENGKLKKQIREIDAEKARDYLYNQFDAVDKKYIEMVEEFFNKTSKEIKTNADNEYLGYSNVISGHYIPIMRDRFSRDRRTTDRRSSIADIITVYNEQFNQHVVQNAKPCEITNIQQIVSTHAKGLADYSCLYMPLKSFDRLYNAPVVLDDGRSTTIREILNDVWPDADNYLADLFSDIQGAGRPTGRFDTLDKFAQRITNTWVPSTLSGNLSVIMNQTTSYISASQAIEPKYLVQAMGAIGHNMKEIGDRADEYSKIILSRSFEEGAIRSQTNVEQVNKVGKFLGKGIEYTDRQICLLIFHAAEIKAEANGDGAIGTEENSRAAAIIADKVIQETQSMTSPAERGAWQRSPNMLSRAVTQFAGDSMKSFSYLYSSVARFFAHLNRVKARDTTYEADLKQDAKKIGRSVATIAATSAYMAAIAWLMRVLLNTTEDEPEEEALNVLGDFAGNVVGIMPLVSDVYSYFVDGYEITPTSIDLINDTLNNTKNTFTLLGNVVSGKNVTQDDIVKTIKGVAATFGSFTGTPVSPLLKQTTGLVRRISPSAIYWYDSAFSSESFSHDLERALEKGDERLAQTILEMRYKHEGTGEINGEEILEICRLYQVLDEEGKYRTEVIPQRIPEEITKRKDRKKFESIYGEASGAVIKLIDSLEYKNLTDEEKIMAIKNTYKLYYNKAKSEVLETEITNAQAYAMILKDTSNLYLSQAKKSSMEAYEGKAGKEVSVKDQVKEYLNLIGLTEEEYVVISYALGYRGKENKSKFLEYVNTLNLSEEDKEQIAKRLGFIVEKGKIVEEEKK